MTPKEFFDKVSRMRKAHKECFIKNNNPKMEF